MDLQEAVRTSLSNLTEALRAAQLAAAVEQGFENYVYAGDVGTRCTNCESPYEKCSKNLSKGPCCGRCGFTDTHRIRRLGTFLNATDSPAHHVERATRDLRKVQFPTTKEALQGAYRQFQCGTMAGADFADVVGAYLKENS